MESMCSVTFGSTSGDSIDIEEKSSCISWIYFSEIAEGEVFSDFALAIILSSTSVIFLT